MFRIFTAAAVLALAPLTAGAIDLDALSGQQKRDACAAYVWIDLQLARQAGMISQARYSNMEIRLFMKTTVAKGNGHNPAANQLIGRNVEAIVAENPEPKELMAKAAYCRGFLKL